MSFTLALETSAPVAVCRPAVKKNLISKMPCGVSIYLPETARLTVVSWTPTTSAICAMVMGFRCATPFSMNSRWRLHNLPRDVQDGLLPLVQALDEKFSGADFFADVILHLGVILALRHQILVGVADAQDAGRCSSLVVTDEIVADFLHENLGRDKLVGVRQKGAAGPRFQARDVGERGLDFLHVDWPVPRAISGMRRLPSSSMKSRMMRYSSDSCRPARSSWSSRHSRKSPAPTPGGSKV